MPRSCLLPADVLGNMPSVTQTVRYLQSLSYIIETLYSGHSVNDYVSHLHYIIIVNHCFSLDTLRKLYTSLKKQYTVSLKTRWRRPSNSETNRPSSDRHDGAMPCRHRKTWTHDAISDVQPV